MIKKNDTLDGRSMLEMIGVLAVVASLSIGGVLGLNHAMLDKKANDLLSDINLAYASIYTLEDCQNERQNVSFNPRSGRNIQVRCEDAKYRFVYVDNIDKEICERLLKFKGSYNLSAFDQENLIEIQTCNEVNDLAFSLDQKKFCSGNLCGNTCCYGSEVCVNGSCIVCPTTLPEGLCVLETEGCPTLNALVGTSCDLNGICGSDKSCISCPAGTSLEGNGGLAGYGDSGYVGCFCNNEGEAWNNETQSCFGCPENSSGSGSGQLTSVAGCYCNEDLPYWSSETSSCVSCPDSMEYVGRECIFTNENCNGVRCDEGQYCQVAPNGWCTGTYYKMDADNSTARCVDVPSHKIYVSEKYGKFASCNSNLNFWSSDNFCKALNGRMFRESDSGCDGLSSAESGVSRSCSNEGWTSGSPSLGSLDENGKIQGCTFSEVLCELYWLGEFRRNSWIDNAWKNSNACNATRLAVPGGFSTWKSRNQASYSPLCVLD